MSVYYTWKNVKAEYNNNKFKITAPTWDKTFDLPDGSYNIQQIQDYFEFIIKKHETITDDNFPIRIYKNNINRIVFKIKTGYKLELNETVKYWEMIQLSMKIKIVLIYHNLRSLQQY